MAAVKTQRGGPRVEPRWHGGACASCANAITGYKDAWRVKLITFQPRRTLMVWQHRTCSAK